jgi:hypothetical protein
MSRKEEEIKGGVGKDEENRSRKRKIYSEV